jgi:hypothetical protein
VLVVGGEAGVAFSEEEIAYLRSQRLARIATVSAGGQPDVVPLGFDQQEVQQQGPREPPHVFGSAISPRLGLLAGQRIPGAEPALARLPPEQIPVHRSHGFAT